MAPSTSVVAVAISGAFASRYLSRRRASMSAPKISNATKIAVSCASPIESATRMARNTAALTRASVPPATSSPPRFNSSIPLRCQPERMIM
jgi:hypothetical protein